MENQRIMSSINPNLLLSPDYYISRLISNSNSYSLLMQLMLVILSVLAGFLVLINQCRPRKEGNNENAVKSPQLPPGSFGFPLIGETLQFALFSKHPIGTPSPFLLCRLQRYGQVFKTHLMGRKTLVSMDPELNRLLLSNEERLVRAYFPRFICNIVGPVLSMHGPHHKRLREIAVSQLNPNAVQHKHLVPIQEYALRHLGSWATIGIIDAQIEAKKFVFSYIVHFLLGLDANDPIIETLMKNYSLLMTGYSAIPINFPGTTYYKVLQARENVLDILRTLIRTRKREKRSQSLDFTDVMLHEVDECGNSYSEQDVVDFLYFLVLGGFETSSILLTNLVKFLSENQQVVDELRREHMLIRKDKASHSEKLTWEDYKTMQFTEKVIKETLRMASIVHYVTRETIQDIYFKDMVIPKGWMVLISFSMVHLNSKYYTNPLKFDPWRWQDSSVDNSCINTTKFLAPFGGGIRSCLGSTLAKFEASIFIHYLVTLNKWERIVDKDGQLDQVSSLSFPTMRKGLPLKVEHFL